MRHTHVRTWIEISEKYLHHNTGEFFSRIGRKAFMMAVVKSNAYGHGLVTVADALGWHPEFRRRGWFGVDSIVEALRLRKEGIKNPMLVLGFTLPERLADAARAGVIVTVSNRESLRALLRSFPRPAFHIKIDTGMHRQGFFTAEVPHVISFLKKHALVPDGMYTHFAMAKDRGYPAYTAMQFKDFMKAIVLFKNAGYSALVRHAAATGGALLFPETHLDMVRIGMGLYGYPPSVEAALNLNASEFGLSPISMKPVMTWKTVVGETHVIPVGSPVGYDLTERVRRRTNIAVLPIGYWHGFDRGLSGIGEVLIGGRRRKVLGRVSMDMIVVDGTDAPGARVGDVVVLIGRQGKGAVYADEMGGKIGTSCYEVLTRTNPLIQRALI
ncbi:MAG: alanine racemase [Candidatus Sungbacteria bacterium RIFCSPLOWO2_02_FULL_51_17]|uniref:Alanine racemase n=1 Tax=Candidatus Sungbacteria bacterium RIFCSPHIGHO2_02_FULL_51_29 TaxID=1802273 RepID=A0A1G2KWV9_9BACT|nr:MAG: alanine racemase [Candidatus Sungbacteria bacterium RIFCSPHIGHO2_01_FULL_51_22]OHA03674.1 MAG: alanine racemase [Candidatus Sungbacteria bacterium RIFCSPHIGHO2_02_FULL_51_29]OHA07420.1 MAG: alanine racemase [Candidatus Sungbacteria bacterium RIFCSPLOWO2_01_FULL_51_34]OHA11305.1 MAG: alanine racemase [Candidatus Sungbacteria bacterium RIFCSPLOWO2_02_FULL_51_17]